MNKRLALIREILKQHENGLLADDEAVNAITLACLGQHYMQRSAGEYDERNAQ